jgi:hypothetical protein
MEFVLFVLLFHFVNYYFKERSESPNDFPHLSPKTLAPKKNKIKPHGLSPRANYTDRATAACRRSDCQLVRIEGATWPA